MDTSSNQMHSSLDSALKTRHSGRTWSTTPFNLVKRVKILSNPDNNKQWAHLVFTLDKTYLRSSAIGFDQFREDTRGLSMLKSFSFFVKMVYNLQQAGSDPDGQNIVIFFEWVKHATNEKHVAVRLHVFSNRRASEAALHTLVNKMVNENKKNIETAVKQKKTVKSEDHVFHYDMWQSVSSVSEYARQVADVYTRNHEASLAMDDPGVENPTHKAHPCHTFRKDSEAFVVPNGILLQNDPQNYTDDEGNFIFPDETRIYRIMPSDMNIDKFFHRYLPDFFFTRVKHPDVRIDRIPERMHVRRVYITPHLDRERFAKYLETFRHVGTDVWEVEADKIDEFSDKFKTLFNVWNTNDTAAQTSVSGNTLNFLQMTPLMHEYDFHDQSITADAIPIISPLIKTLLTDKHSLSDIDVLKIRTEYLSEWVTNRRELQEKIVEMFVERVWDDPCADVSEPAKMILMWKTHMRRPKVHNFKKIDPNMSIFANRTIRVMEVLDKVFMVSAAHKTLFLLIHSMLNAYDQVLGLHFNQIYTGEGATSKSFLFVMAKLLAIQGTCDSLTYQTTRADAVDGDLIDQITIFEEAPPGMFFTTKGADRTQEAMFKEKLTSQVVKCKEFWRDENTGERKNRIAKSQCIGVCMGATNDNPADCSEAMKTRFYWGAFEKVSNGRSIQICQRGAREQEECPAAMKILYDWVDYFRDQQLKVWTVFKFMYMGILKRPTLKAADIVYSQITTKLKRDFKINVAPRTKERFEILCVVYTIINALEKVFNIHGGEHACDYDKDGNPIPKPFHPVQLLEIEPYLVCDEEIALFSFTQISEEVVDPNEYKVLAALWKIHGESREYKEEIKSMDGGEKKVTVTNHSYVKLHQGKRLLVEIANSIPVSAGKMSPHNIQAVLSSLQDRYIPSKSYVPKNNTSASNDTFPDNFPQPVAEGLLTSSSMLMIENNHTMIHMDMFSTVRRGEDINKVKESMRALEHKYAFSHRKFVMGASQRGSNSGVIYPGVFDVVHLNQNENHEIKMVNPIHMNKQTQIIHGVKEVDERQRYHVELIKVDLSVKAAMTHASILNIPHRLYVQKYMEQAQHYESVEETLDYPDDITQNAGPTDGNVTGELSEGTLVHSDAYGFTMEDLESMYVQSNKRARFN